MIINELSLKQQSIGRKKLLTFSFLNGIALTFITGSVLSLYLLKVGCSAPVVAMISSFGYLGSLFAFFGKNSIARIGASATLRYSWAFSGIIGLLLGLAPFLGHFSHNTSTTVILITILTFLFFIFKSIGTASSQPLMGEFTDDDNQGKFSSKYFMNYNIATIIAIGITILLLSYFHQLLIFQIIIFTGGVIKIGISCIFIGMRETETPKNSARAIETKNLLSQIWKNRDLRNFLFARSFGRAGLILVSAISILALKKMYGISDSIALVLVFVQLGSGICITYINGVISEETGPKPLLLIYLSFLFIISILWVLAPVNFIWSYCIIIFILGGMCLSGLDSCLNHYYLTVIPPENSVGISLWFTVISGTVAGIAGLVVGGGLLKYISIFTTIDNTFRVYYLIMIILLIPVMLIVLKLKSDSSWKLKDVLKLIVNPKDMHTLNIMHRLQKYTSVENEFESVRKLGRTGSDLSQDRLLYYLESPNYMVKMGALRALYGINLKTETKDILLKELEFGEYITAYLAAFLLTTNKDRRAIPYFIDHIYSGDYYLAGACIRGLVELGVSETYQDIIKLFRETKVPYLAILGSIALAGMKTQESFKALLEKYSAVIPENNYTVKNLHQNISSEQRDKEFRSYVTRRKTVNKQIICGIAVHAGVGDDYYGFLRIFEMNHKKGLLALFEIISSNIKKNEDVYIEVLKSYMHGKINRSEIIKFLIERAKCCSSIPEVKIIGEFLESGTKIDNRLLCCCCLIMFKPR